MLKKRNNYVYCIIHTNNVDFTDIHKAILDYSDYDINQETPLDDMLRAIYYTHKDFYDDIGYNYTSDDHPEDDDFNEGCYGFSRFLKNYFNIRYFKELDDEDLKKLSQVIANRIAYIYSKYVNEQNTVVTASSTIHIAKEIDSVKISEPKIINDAILITDRGVYTVKLAKTNLKSYEDIRRETINTVKRNYEEQLKAIVNSYKSMIKSLKEQIDEVKTNAFADAMSAMKTITEEGWTIENGELILKAKLTPDKVIYQRTVYRLPEEHIGKFYVKDIHIPLTTTVTSAKCSDSYHPNINDSNSICLGDLEGKPLSIVVTEIPNTLKTMNLDSAFPNSATRELEDIIEKLYLNRRYITEEVFEVDE